MSNNSNLFCKHLIFLIFSMLISACAIFENNSTDIFAQESEAKKTTHAARHPSPMPIKSKSEMSEKKPQYYTPSTKKKPAYTPPGTTEKRYHYQQYDYAPPGTGTGEPHPL